MGGIANQCQWTQRQPRQAVNIEGVVAHQRSGGRSREKGLNVGWQLAHLSRWRRLGQPLPAQGSRCGAGQGSSQKKPQWVQALPCSSWPRSKMLA